MKDIFKKISVFFSKVFERVDRLPLVPKILVISIPFVLAISVMGYVTFRYVIYTPDSTALRVSHDVTTMGEGSGSTDAGCDSIDDPKTE